MRKDLNQIQGSSLLSSFRIQLRVVGALLMREIITRFGRHDIGFLWLLVEPMMFTLGVTALWIATQKVHLQQHDLQVAAFALTGYSSVILWRNSANRCSMAITPNLTLFYHRNVRVIDIFYARIALEIASASASFIVLMCIFVFFDFIKPPVDIFLMIAGWLLQCFYAVSLGILVGVISERSELFERFWHVTTYILFPISGALFIVDWLPATLQKIVLIFPSVHASELLRSGYFGPSIHAHYDIAYTIIVCSVMLLIGLVGVRQSVKLIGN